jgi:hypothetical protein
MLSVPSYFLLDKNTVVTKSTMAHCISPEPTEATKLSNQDGMSSVVMMKKASSCNLPRPPLKRNIDVCCEPDHDQDTAATTKKAKTTTTTTSAPQDRKRQRRITSESSSPSSSTGGVRFASEPQVHITPRWSDIDITNSWYSKHEINTFKRLERADAAILRTLIQTTSTISTLPQESAVYRGLERLLSLQLVCEISNRRRQCVSSVLTAQRAGYTFEDIAQVSMECTEKATSWALTLGQI